jgi:xanthine dehydrogenase FAD-binding subunit
MANWKNYAQPKTVDDALQSLVQAQGEVAVIGGGTDLLLDIQQGRHCPVDTLVDVTGIEEMQDISISSNQIFLGASVTHAEIVNNPILQQHAQCVVEGCGLIGGPQVRNVATIGGNVSHALPAGDGTISLMAMDSEVQLASAEGRRWVSLGDVFAGPGKTTFDRNQEIVVGFRFSTSQPGEGSAFDRVMRPQGVAIAIQNMAVWLRCTPNGVVDSLRLSVGPAGPTPLRAVLTEKVVSGKKMNQGTFDLACEELASEARLRTSRHRATSEYRYHLLPVLFKRVLGMAYQRSTGKPLPVA